MSGVDSVLADLATRLGPAILGLGRGARGGSAVIVAPGQAITLARNLRTGELGVRHGDGRETAATLAGVDDALGVALLLVDTEGVTPVAWGEGPATLGTSVFALGDPGGRGLRVTHGHVSCAPRRLRGPNGRLLGGVIEHTAPLPRGCGGAALVDAAGGLIGLNAVREDGGLILALPTIGLRERLADLSAGRSSRPRRLGVALVAPRAGARMRRAVGLPDRAGLLVRDVEAGAAAERAGIRRGDLLVAVGDRELSAVEDLHDALEATAGGSALDLAVVRGVQELRLSVTPSAATGPEAVDEPREAPEGPR